MEYKVTIRAHFDFDAQVDAKDAEAAKQKASDALMDYLSVTLSQNRKFDYFHEYVLKEEILKVEKIS